MFRLKEHQHFNTIPRKHSITNQRYGFQKSSARSRVECPAAVRAKGRRIGARHAPYGGAPEQTLPLRRTVALAWPHRRSRDRCRQLVEGLVFEILAGLVRIRADLVDLEIGDAAEPAQAFFEAVEFARGHLRRGRVERRFVFVWLGR